MNFKGNFKPIAKADVSGLINMVNHLNDNHWLLSSDSNKIYEVHQNTQTINLVYDDDYRHMHPTKHPALDVFGPVIETLLSIIAQYYETQEINQQYLTKYGPGYFIRINLVKLLAGGIIESHQDKNFSLAHSHRIHVPIITDNTVFFTVGDESVCMHPGEIYEINNRRFHSVQNMSQKDRVHLILDFVIPGEPCCCAEKHHPGVLCNPEICMPTDRLNIACHCLD